MSLVIIGPYIGTGEIYYSGISHAGNDIYEISFVVCHGKDSFALTVPTADRRIYANSNPGNWASEDEDSSVWTGRQFKSAVFMELRSYLIKAFRILEKKPQIDAIVKSLTE